MAHAVDAGRVFSSLFFVATSAIDPLGRDVVVRVFDRQVGMASCTGVCFVDRSQEPGLINEQGKDITSGVGFEEGLVRMAVETSAVLDLGWCRTGALNRWNSRGPANHKVYHGEYDYPSEPAHQMHAREILGEARK